MVRLEETQQKLDRLGEHARSAPVSPTARYQPQRGPSPRRQPEPARSPPPQLLRMSALLTAAREDVLSATRRAEAAEQRAHAALAETEACRQRASRAREPSAPSGAPIAANPLSDAASGRASEPQPCSVCDGLEVSKENSSASANGGAPRLVGVAALRADHLKELSALRASLHAAKLEAQARLGMLEEAQRQREAAESLAAHCTARADAAEADAAARAADVQQMEHRAAEMHSKLRFLQSSLGEAERDRDEQSYRADEATLLHRNAAEQARACTQQLKTRSLPLLPQSEARFCSF